MDTNSFKGMQAHLIAEITVPRTPVPGRLCQIRSSLEGAKLIGECPDSADPAPQYVRKRITTPEDIMKVEQALGTEHGILEQWRIQRLERMALIQAAEIDILRKESQELREIDATPEGVYLKHEI